MSLTELFGFACVTTMFVSYLLDKRGRWWGLVFAAGCFGACGYAVMIGSIPFAVVEGLWGVVALKRWASRGGTSS